MIHGLALCAGIGGLDLGVEIALGGQYRAVGYVEREAYPATVLMVRMEEALLVPAPVWDDLTTFDGVPYRGRVHLITSGLPCQPYSVAGKYKGNEDKRALWPHFVRIVREIAPAAFFIENTPQFLKFFRPAWERLRRMGFEFAPPIRTACSCFGAPHRRRRVFLFAAHPERIDLWDEPWRRCGPGRESPALTGDDRSAVHPESYSERWEGERGLWILDGEPTLRYHLDGCRVRAGDERTPWEVESPVLRVDDGPTADVDRRRVVGNAASPLVAADAFARSVAAVREEILR